MGMNDQKERLLTLVVRVSQPEADWLWRVHMTGQPENGILAVDSIADGDTAPRMFKNFYLCPRCGHHWEDVYECQPDDDCTVCGCRHVSPERSEDA
jgi:hypothetical protein